MIRFANYNSFFNHVVHLFLDIEIFNENDDEELESFIQFLLPDYLVREQFERCKVTFYELYYWTNDHEDHNMNCFHQYILYYFLCYMSDLQEDMDDFNHLYFDDYSRQMILEMSQDAFLECEWTLEDEIKWYTDVSNYPELLFRDTDFLKVEDLIQMHQHGNQSIFKRLGIFIDDYFDLLPQDIKNQYPSKHITLSGEIKDFLEFLKYKNLYGSFSKLFWELEKRVEDFKIEIIIDNILIAYFFNRKLDIFWNVKRKNKEISYIFYKRREKNKKVVIHFIVNDVSLMNEDSFEKDEDCETVFYVVFCFSEQEYQAAKDFAKFSSNIYAFDLRKQKYVSQR